MTRYQGLDKSFDKYLGQVISNYATGPMWSSSAMVCRLLLDARLLIARSKIDNGSAQHAPTSIVTVICFFLQPIRTVLVGMSLNKSSGCAKARRAANNNYKRLIKTLVGKLEKLHRVYDTRVYLIAERDGRFRECVSVDRTGRPWLRPDQETLVSDLNPLARGGSETDRWKDRMYPRPILQLLSVAAKEGTVHSANTAAGTSVSASHETVNGDDKTCEVVV